MSRSVAILALWERLRIGSECAYARTQSNVAGAQYRERRPPGANPVRALIRAEECRRCHESGKGEFSIGGVHPPPNRESASLVDDYFRVIASTDDGCVGRATSFFVASFDR